jgi:nitroreductase
VIISAAWSFMLAARARGLGHRLITFHLRHEREAVELLGIPSDKVMQAALVPVAYSVGTDFRRAPARRWTRWFTGTGSRTSLGFS